MVETFATNNNLELIIEEESSEEVPAEQVISQSPSADSALFVGDTLTVVISTGPVEISTVEFSKIITIPYEERTVESTEEENTNNEDETEEEPTAPILLPNEIQIYIDDFNREITDVAYSFLIEEDTERELSFVVEEGSSARYRITYGDGTLIEDSIVSPDSN